jgi:hypothetical protein
MFLITPALLCGGQGSALLKDSPRDPSGEDMWEKVSIRLHTPRKIFPFGIQADEFMLYGNVD